MLKIIESHPMNKILGKNIRLFRLSSGISQSFLADKIGVSYQQLQKYEAGKNRVSPDKLIKLSRTLNQPITAFFEGAELGSQQRTAADIDLFSKENLEFLRLYQSLPSNLKSSIKDLMKSYTDSTS